MDKETNEMKLAYWSGVIKEAKYSGMKVAKWCELNQITKRQYYYWHKKVMHDTYESAVERGLLPGAEAGPAGRDLPMAPEFAELTAPDMGGAHEPLRDPGVSIRWNEFTIAVNPGFSEGELARILKVMRHV